MKNSHLITSFKTLLQSRTLVHSIFLAFVVLLFFSCKRETGITQEKEHIKIFEAAQSWLKKKATASTIEAREQIQKLINNLDKNSISYTKSTSDSYFSAISINQKQVDNDTESYFVLKMKKTGEIEWTIIVEKNSTAECNNPSETLAAFLLMNSPPDGRYTLRSTLGTFMHEVTYKNQAIQTIKTLKKKPKTNSRTEEYCTEWYLVTTYYYPDGSTSITEEYLGTTCNNCPPNSVCEMQIDDSGGAGVLLSTESIDITTYESGYVNSDMELGIIVPIKYMYHAEIVRTDPGNIIISVIVYPTTADPLFATYIDSYNRVVTRKITLLDHMNSYTILPPTSTIASINWSCAVHGKYSYSDGTPSWTRQWSNSKTEIR